MMVGSNLKESQLQQIVDKSIRLADQDEDGKISFEEFCKAVGNTDITNKMVVEVWIWKKISSVELARALIMF